MSSIVIAGDTSGSVTLQAPAVAGSTVLNLPSTSGTIQTSGAGYTTNGVAYATSTSALSTGSALTFDGNQIAVTPASGNAVSKLFGGTGAGVGSYFAVYAQGANSGYFGTDSGITGSGTSNDLTIYPASTNNIRFYQGGAEQMRLTSTGLGIGTSNPSFKLDVAAARATSRVTSTTGTNAVDFQTLNTGGQLLLGIDNSAGSSLFGVGAYAAGLWYTGAYPLVFGTNNTERARITSAGTFVIGDTTAIGNERLYVLATTSTGYAFRLYNQQATAANTFGQFINYTASSPNGTGNQFIRCDDSTTSRFEVRSNGGIANYSANNVNLSDRREKTNFAPAKSYLDAICSIPVQTYNYIDQNLEEDGGLTLGVVAQDVQAVAPELVTESNWGTEEEPKMRLSIYQTDLQYALMKCIQEQQALINTLTDRISVLENK